MRIFRPSLPFICLCLLWTNKKLKDNTMVYLHSLTFSRMKRKFILLSSLHQTYRHHYHHHQEKKHPFASCWEIMMERAFISLKQSKLLSFTLSLQVISPWWFDSRVETTQILEIRKMYVHKLCTRHYCCRKLTFDLYVPTYILIHFMFIFPFSVTYTYP